MKKYASNASLFGKIKTKQIIQPSLFIAFLSNCSVCFAISAKLLNFCNSVMPSQVERANSEHFLRNVEQLHWKQLWTDVLIPSPKSMIEHILRNKIIKSFNYFSHRLTGIALMLSISLKLTNGTGMLRITFTIQNLLWSISEKWSASLWSDAF